MALPLLREHTDALVAKLTALGLSVGDGKAPAGKVPSDGYCTVYSIPGGSRTGTLAAPDDDASFIFQVTCVGESRKQAEWLADKALQVLGKYTLTVTGRKVPRVSLIANPGVRRSDDNPSVFYSTPRVSVMTTPV